MTDLPHRTPIGATVPESDDAAAAPLCGWRVLVPRAPDRSGEVMDLLAAAGAAAVAVPLIGTAPPADEAALDLSLVELAKGSYDWAAFTSGSAVDAVLARAQALSLSPAVPADTRVAAVGSATAAVLRRQGLPVDLVPAAAGSAAALAAIWPHPRGDQTVLLPRSDLAAAVLPQALSALGYRVSTVVAYRTVITPPPTPTAAELAAGSFDAVLFTSPSTVRALAAVHMPESTVRCAIGESTAAEASKSGRPVHVVAAEPTAQSLLQTLSDFALAHPRHVEA